MKRVQLNYTPFIHFSTDLLKRKLFSRLPSGVVYFNAQTEVMSLCNEYNNMGNIHMYICTLKRYI